MIISLGGIFRRINFCVTVCIFIKLLNYIAKLPDENFIDLYSQKVKNLLRRLSNTVERTLRKKKPYK